MKNINIIIDRKNFQNAINEAIHNVISEGKFYKDMPQELISYLEDTDALWINLMFEYFLDEFDIEVGF